MKQKYPMKGLFASVVTFALVISAGALANAKPIEVSSTATHPPMAPNGYHEGWPQIIIGDESMWGGIISPVITDVDQDGSKELIVTQQGEPSKLYVFEQNGSLKFDIIEMPEYVPWINPRCFPSTGDINNDGFEEILFESTGPANNKIMIYNHTGALFDEWELAYRVSDDLYSSIVLADVNSDDNLEIIYGGWWTTGCRLVVLDNEGNNVPGFPVLLENIQMSETNTPAVGNFDEDIEFEIAVISHRNNQPVDKSNIRAFNTNGSLLWEQTLDAIVYNDPAVGDINHDGYDEVMFTSPKGIHVLDREGNYLVNKSLGSDNADTSNIAVADLNKDKNLEVIFGYYTSIYTMDYQGTILWSHDTGWNAHYPPIVGDITGDGSPDIVVTSSEQVWAWTSAGDVISGYPEPIEVNALGACSLEDIDNNNDMELIASSDWKWNGSYNEGYIYVWDLPGAYNASTMEWPVFQHDPQHTGMYPGSLVANAHGPYEGIIGQHIQFFGSASGGSTPYSWWWEFGDGSTSTEQNPTHPYMEANTYIVSLTVTDAAFNTDTDTTTATIRVEAPVLEIQNITGRIFKVKSSIKNIGGVVLHDIQWTITVTGGFILLGRETTGSIAALNAGEEQHIASKLIFGFGSTVIKIIATAQGSATSKEQNATIVLFFIRMK